MIGRKLNGTAKTTQKNNQTIFKWSCLIFYGHVLDDRYAADRTNLCRAYLLLVNDVMKLFEYIEPSDDNLNAYSHRTYELLLRASTEFETNSKRILIDNNYTFRGNPNILDYYKINNSSKLSDYSVTINFWRNGPKTFQPFGNWSTGNHSLLWYQAYNAVKHDRQQNFPQCSLEHVLNSVTGLLIVLFSQFSIYAFNPYQEIGMYDGDPAAGYVYVNESIFSLQFPINWNNNEKYDFDWDTLKQQQSPYDTFTF
ncbi:hypothetical protein [Paenibacillus qinlingensis]|uniref:hypothetical protein n=1 Tax=Paenibacillus qinlingensis TaxID=1837343 RepID=UPI0015679DA9|nr:hypothetical protein [Paenibacillus qinlingensis]NQX63745.1 hypothetical protein [Paenibacillus qinlingensis]